MEEIQLGSGSSSSATHRLTQSSHTLDRRYVGRPTNIAIEEASRASIREEDRPVSAPSRLVNLRVHAADLAQQQAQAAQESTHSDPSSAVIPKIIELGSSDYSSSADAQPPVDLSQMVPDEAPVEEVSYLPAVSQAQSISYSQNYNNLNDNYNYPTIEPAQSESITATDTMDTQSLAMSIAADYAAASMGAAANEAAPIASDSIDTIAQAASEAIAAIRTASDPEEVAEQVASLQTFAANIRANSDTPEMHELSDTIDKFVSVAMKSSRVQEEVEKKLAEKAQAEESAKTSVKIATKKPAAKTTTKKPSVTNKTIKRPVTSKAKPSMARTTASTARVSRPISAPRRTARTATKPTLVADEDQALRKALRSVAAMDGEEETTTKLNKKRTTRKKGSGKRFALAFFCAIACVGGVVYLVGSNIPDISVKVAAMQTGIEATYPAYVPRDFSLSDISSEEGKITLTFKGPNKATFVLTEEKSSWDSTTLLRNFVEPTWQSNYTTTHEQGITIYMSGANATWVNGGVLYKITANANTLTKKQLRNIVISL